MVSFSFIFFPVHLINYGEARFSVFPNIILDKKLSTDAVQGARSGKKENLEMKVMHNNTCAALRYRKVSVESQF